MTKAEILKRIDAILSEPPGWVERVGAWRRNGLERLQLDLEIDLRRESHSSSAREAPPEA